MAIIKSFTDISQSKKLAEILPIETADMKWYFWKDEIDSPKLPTFGYSKTAAEDYKDTEAVYLPCWSLSALLNILPSGKALIHDKQDLGYKVICKNIDSNFYNNCVDACVDMIVKLKENNIL